MEVFIEERFCKYCQQKLELCTEEGLECQKCKESVHLKCLRRGSVPGGLHGDVFYTFTCQDCSPEKSEVFTRNKISWLQIISLVLYHLQNKSPGLARKGFFHWRHHIATFIDKNWEMLVPSDIKKKKAWTGTVAGTLSHFSGYIFLSGTAVINEQAWWALMYPKLSPYVLSSIYSVMTLEKQVIKSRKGQLVADAELFQTVLPNCIVNEEFLEPFVFSSFQPLTDTLEEDPSYVALSEEFKKNTKPKNSGLKRKHSLTNFGNSSKMLMKLSSSSSLSDELNPNITTIDSREKYQVSNAIANEESKTKDAIKLLDPLCHYNTSLNNLSQMKGVTLQVKLTGGIRQELILSPYSAIYLKPYIRRDVETFPIWLKLMAEIQIVANSNNADYVLPARAPIDYTYVQPEHIPAINSLCNQFFWPGIDLTESLQYPDFSCVALYKRLIIGFAFLVPDVTYTENYLSFLFTRPAWRNCGVAKFMIYHLIQTSLGKDITLHVSINSPALFLYQKFGFKVENVVLDFYDKYWRSDVKESKHAFFCRLERFCLAANLSNKLESYGNTDPDAGPVSPSASSAATRYRMMTSTHGPTDVATRGHLDTATLHHFRQDAAISTRNHESHDSFMPGMPTIWLPFSPSPTSPTTLPPLEAQGRRKRPTSRERSDDNSRSFCSTFAIFDSGKIFSKNFEDVPWS